MNAEAQPTAMHDRLERPLRDLRISVTDRCNFRCPYCMPKEVFGRDFSFLPRTQILSYEEITRTVRLLAGFGLRKVRLTGGEPLLRADLPALVRMLHEAAPDLQIALTTNGSRLAALAPELAAAGLSRVTVSLDSVDDDIFRRMNDADFPVARVLEGIDAAADAGLGPVKINAVIHRAVNDSAVLDLARRFKESGHILRFIEYMDVGHSNGWRLHEVVPGVEIVRRINDAWPLLPVDAAYRGEVAQRYRYADGVGEIGVITSVTQPFCGDCTRMRLSADGQIYTCLFAVRGTDLRAPLRDGSTDDALRALLRRVWGAREDRYSELRSAQTEGLNKVEMSYIGG